MSVNIKNGRRTLIVEPEWFTRPDGLERAVMFQPGFNSDPDPDAHKDYGVHSMEITWFLRGPRGGVSFTIYTGWTPGELSPGHGLPPVGVPHRGMPGGGSPYPHGALFEEHAPVPQYEEHGADPGCLVLPGDCYWSRTGIGTDDLAAAFCEHGEQVVWAQLEAMYAGIKTETS